MAIKSPPRSLQTMMRPRKVPIRTCVACRTSGDKKTLVRIVRTPAGEVVLDPTGKMSGRGAYLCPTVECLRRAMKEKRLPKALRAQIPEETIRQLEKTMEQRSEDM